MERLRTLLLARSHVVVLDPDKVASATTRPVRDRDVDRLEDELAQLGFVMSLDLAMAMRRLPGQALDETRTWIRDTLGTAPLQAGGYLQRILPWLATRADQPCPWCGRIALVGALDPCGHLVCRECWSSGSFVGCPICHRRVAPGEPFVEPPEAGERVQHHGGRLVLLQLGVDLAGGARARLERLLARGTPLSPAERADVETIVDAVGPRVVDWLPARIPERATMAVVLARLMQIAPDPSALARGAAAHLASATCVLRVAAVLLGGNPELAPAMRFRSMRRALRRAVLEALDRLPAADVAEEVARHRALWKRIGEQLHPGELATQLPNAARAFALARGRGRIARWAAPVELALARRDALAAVAVLAERPEALLRRCDQLLRIADSPAIEEAIVRVLPRGSAAHLLVLASHLARRGTAWPRRVFLHGDPLRAWATADVRPPLRADALVGAIRSELLARAERRRNFPRAMLDRTLVDALLSSRGSERALPEGVALPLAGCSALELFDHEWRHVATLRDPSELHTERARHALVVARGREVAVGALRFELRGRAALHVPLAIDLGERRVRWIDLRIADRAQLVHGYRAALVHAARDVADASHARPTPWDLACIHAAARANVIYVRERDDSYTIYRRRDRESPRARLDRLLAGTADSYRLAQVPTADAPTWFALVTGDVALPAGSAGFTLDGRPPSGATPVTISELIAELEIAGAFANATR